MIEVLAASSWTNCRPILNPSLPQMLYTALAETITLRIVPLTGASNAITQDWPIINGASSIKHIPLIEMSTVRPINGGLPPSSMTFTRQRNTLRGAILVSGSAIFLNIFNQEEIISSNFIGVVRM
jgi:hypothetical protein